MNRQCPQLLAWQSLWSVSITPHIGFGSAGNVDINALTIVLHSKFHNVNYVRTYINTNTTKQIMVVYVLFPIWNWGMFLLNGYACNNRFMQWFMLEQIRGMNISHVALMFCIRTNNSNNDCEEALANTWRNPLLVKGLTDQMLDVVLILSEVTSFVLSELCWLVNWMNTVVCLHFLCVLYPCITVLCSWALPNHLCLVCTCYVMFMSDKTTRYTHNIQTINAMFIEY